MAHPQVNRPDSGEKNEGGGYSWPGGLAQELALSGQPSTPVFSALDHLSGQDSGYLKGLGLNPSLHPGRQAGERERGRFLPDVHSRGRGRKPSVLVALPQGSKTTKGPSLQTNSVETP